jgi:hypothetical protein
MRPARLLVRSIPVAACLAAAAPAFAAVDDQVEPASPVAAPAGFVATARKLIDDTLEKQHAVVAVLRDNVVPRVMAGSWRLGAGTPYMPRATAPVSRPVPNDFAGGALSSSSEADSLDVTLGGRWRVLHGDASSHVPLAAWMPDMQSAHSPLRTSRWA